MPHPIRISYTHDATLFPNWFTIRWKGKEFAIDTRSHLIKGEPEWEFLAEVAKHILLPTYCYWEGPKIPVDTQEPNTLTRLKIYRALEIRHCGFCLWGCPVPEARTGNLHYPSRCEFSLEALKLPSGALVEYPIQEAHVPRDCPRWEWLGRVRPESDYWVKVKSDAEVIEMPKLKGVS